MPRDQIRTYHCICSELVLAASNPMERMPKRKVDGAAICKVTKSDVPLPSAVVLSGLTFGGTEPIVLKLEDGFEKRYAARCGRCDLQIGYMLDKSQFEEKENGMRMDVLYLLPGGLMTTEEMKGGEDMEHKIDLITTAAA